MSNQLAKQANRSPEPQLPHPKPLPDSERAKQPPMPGASYMPYAEKPALSEPPYKPYGEKPAPDEQPYEPYKDI
ncbi:MAG: hypothetical protein LAP86_26195 [Acidobacteriia bacterium]|nr:hypothetical protein [Terriglobia bacterium]